MSRVDLRDVTVNYGGLRAVDSASLYANTGEVVGLIGPNGAGKTTLVDAITGFARLSGGQISVAGDRVDHLPSFARARLGLARSFQTLELFEDLTVRANLEVAARRLRFWDPLLDIVWPRRPRSDAGVDEALALLGLDDVADQLPAELSHGRRNLVSAARALASRPQVLLLDEPAAGLDSEETAALAAQLKMLKGWRMSVLVIDHDMELIMEACDRVYVLDFGRIIASGTPEMVRQNPEVIHAYLGTAG